MQELESDLCIKLEPQILAQSLERRPEKFYPVIWENLKKACHLPMGIRGKEERGTMRKLKPRSELIPPHNPDFLSWKTNMSTVLDALKCLNSQEKQVSYKDTFTTHTKKLILPKRQIYSQKLQTTQGNDTR